MAGEGSESFRNGGWGWVLKMRVVFEKGGGGLNPSTNCGFSDEVKLLP